MFDIQYSESGARDRIRTYDFRFRRPTLYPAELRGHMCYLRCNICTPPTLPLSGMLYPAEL